jgi:hypothetical protein
MEDEDRLASRWAVLARARLGQVGRAEKRLVDGGHLGEVDGVGDMTSLELVIEAAVDDDEALDARGEHAALDVVELRGRASKISSIRSNSRRDERLTVAALILIRPSSLTPKQGRALPLAS